MAFGLNLKFRKRLLLPEFLLDQLSRQLQVIPLDGAPDTFILPEKSKRGFHGVAPTRPCLNFVCFSNWERSNSVKRGGSKQSHLRLKKLFLWVREGMSNFPATLIALANAMLISKRKKKIKMSGGKNCTKKK